MALYLADSTIWSWADSGRRPDIAEKLATRFGRGEVVTCAPVVLETMHRARSGKEYDETLRDLFEPLVELSLGDDAARRALQVQRQLAGATDGRHRRPAVDYLIAAIAEVAEDDITMWAFDADLAVICAHTGQPHEAEN